MLPKIGTRKSLLAQAYTNKAISVLGLEGERVLIDSHADLNPTTSIEEMGGKGVFCKEIESALMDRSIDIAVHAFKDLTRDNDEWLHIPCVLERNDFRDCLIGNNSNPRTIGTSSPRRIAQLQDIYPHSQIIPIRGNIDTRIAKQENGEYDAIVLAKAGVDELGYDHKISRIFGTAEMLPAPGQGVIALQTVKPETVREQNLHTMLHYHNHWDTWYCVMAERSMLETVNGDCHTPIGCLSYFDGDNIRIIAKNFETDKMGIVIGEPSKYKELGQELGSQLL